MMSIECRQLDNNKFASNATIPTTWGNISTLLKLYVRSQLKTQNSTIMRKLDLISVGSSQDFVASLLKHFVSLMEEIHNRTK